MNIDPTPSGENPNSSMTSQDAPVVTLGEGPAEQYILNEVKKTRVGLKRTQIIGVLLLLLVGGQLVYITTRFRQSLQPHVAAEIAEGMIMQQVSDRGPEFASQIKQKIPEYLSQTPDYVLQQLPVYRQSVEDNVEKTLTKYCETTSQQLGHHVDTYLDAHKNDIKEMLATPDNPEVLQQNSQALRQELLAYLSEKPAQGESIQTQVNTALASLQDFEKKMHRLAAGKNLTPQEKKTRQVIAVLSRSVNDQNLGEKAQDLVKDVKAMQPKLPTP